MIKSEGMEIASSQADESLEKFNSWKETLTSTDITAMSRGSKLNRTEVAKSIGIAKSTLNDNPLVKRALLKWEEELRSSRLLANLKQATTQWKGDSKTDFEFEDAPLPHDQSLKQLKRLKGELEQLKAQCINKDAEITRLRKELERYAELSEVLAGTGIMPR